MYILKVLCKLNLFALVIGNTPYGSRPTFSFTELLRHPKWIFCVGIAIAIDLNC